MRLKAQHTNIWPVGHNTIMTYTVCRSERMYIVYSTIRLLILCIHIIELCDVSFFATRALCVAAVLSVRLRCGALVGGWT